MPSTDWLASKSACELLDVKPQTLYAYVSRGLVRSIDAGRGTRERLYLREDVARLRARSEARSGHAPVAAAALRWGEPVLDTSIGSIDGRGPVYRGRPATELAGTATFEEVCALLWEQPFDTSLAGALRPLAPKLAPGGLPFDAMLVTAASLATAPARTPGVLVRDLVAACAVPRGGDAVAAARRAPGVAASLLAGLGVVPDEARLRAVDTALVLCADHELNASTFAARIAASSGASLPACIVAGLAALSGPRHGGAVAAVEALVRETRTPDRAAEIIAGYRERAEAVPGFGHPLYPDGDPRGAALLAAAREIAPRARAVRVLASVASAMKLAEREAPTLDVGLVALAGALGLPRGGALALFACGRLGGWIAHALEQQREGHLLRPRARFVRR